MLVHKEQCMKRMRQTLLVTTACLILALVAHAQMGADFFKHPAISAIFHPVIGNGAVYQNSTTGSDDKTTMEMLVVGKDTAAGKEAYWLEFGHEVQGRGTMYMKFLLTKDDFQIQRMIMQLPGRPAMELPTNMIAAQHSQIVEAMSDWAQVGKESVTVPAGTFVCAHWKKNDGTSDVWASETISPFGMVKEVGSSRTMVLVKVLTGVQDHITGPVQSIPGMPQPQN
jgi:hypothetical protein